MDREFFQETKEKTGVNFLRSSDIEVKAGKPITVNYKNEKQEAESIDVDLVLLSPVMVPRASSPELAKILDIPQDDKGFFKETSPELASVSTPREGVFIAGCNQGPKNIQDSVAQAQAAVGRILSSR